VHDIAALDESYREDHLTWGSHLGRGGGRASKGVLLSSLTQISSLHDPINDKYPTVGMRRG